MTRISVVVPVYNSEESLPLLLERLEPVLEKLGTWEVVLVNDGSTDGSWETIVSLAEQYPQVKGINLMRNVGQHGALLCGIREARGEVLITMDDDLRNPPEEIPTLLKELDAGTDVVYGTPREEQHGLFRDLASAMVKMALQSAMGVKAGRKVSAFRAFRHDVCRAFDEYRSPFVSVDVLLSWGTTRFTAVDVDHHARTRGRSHYTLRKLVSHALTMMTGFSTLPLKLASVMGFLLTLFGMGILVFVVGRYLLQGSSVPGFSFLASTIAIFSGAQLLALGIIGEYLARMHFRLMERPPYTVRETTEKANGDP